MDIVRGDGMVVGGSVMVRTPAHPVAIVKMMCVMVTADSGQGCRRVHGHVDKLKLFDSKIVFVFCRLQHVETNFLYVAHKI